MKPAIFIALGLCLPGCAVVSSERSAPAGLSSENIGYYSLPRALVTLEITQNGDAINAAITEPFYAADPAHKYVLNYKSSPLSADTIEVEFESNSTLLKKISTTTEDKTDEIILAAVKSFVGILESGDVTKQATSTVIARLTFDPVDPAERTAALAEANKFLRNFLRFRKFGAAKMSDMVGDWCGIRGASTESTCDSDSWPIKLAVSVPGDVDPAPRSAAVSVPPDCTKGICYRPPLPVKFRLSFGEVALDERTIEIPNAAPVYAMELRKAFMVTKIKNIEFTKGVLTKVRVEKPSEALALVTLPLDIAKAILSVPADILKLKVDLSSQEEALAKKQAALIDAKKELAGKRSVEAGDPPNSRRVVVSVMNGRPLPQSSPLGRRGSGSGAPGERSDDGNPHTRPGPGSEQP
ncbi:hypothetical protein [Reyranella sp. CPCC 100927]|uniref:hypothetical protein n=1 Tax=Reyranella sp. CPCC 100927 TaxID=2599616 RepID=UPI0011B70A8F|nr:hypothetical protein [Reyranella sp. CPCC 100927]TWT06126.1 hypothetical protein FQU96_24080 [Reyranella sp. CPCC 100927]